VRVIGDDGGQLGVMPTHEAMRMAEEKGLDLVEVSPKAVPPVCRVMDYGKFKYEQSKKTNQAKKHASVIEIKEIKFRPKTDVHDYEFKVGHIRRFLEEGNKVRLVIAFRGREIVHPETGRSMLEKVIKKCSDVAHVEQIPMMDGRRMVMVVSPRPGRPGAPTTTAPAPAVPGAMPGAMPGVMPGVMIGRPSTPPPASGASAPVAAAITGTIGASPPPAADAPAAAPAAAGSAPRPNQTPVASSARPVGNRPNPPVRSGS
jgi:translation initiation factor IF-3